MGPDTYVFCTSFGSPDKSQGDFTVLSSDWYLFMNDIKGLETTLTVTQFSPQVIDLTFIWKIKYCRVGMPEHPVPPKVTSVG